MEISVVLCTYNGERFIENQLDSILNQTIPVTQVIIIDDFSSDSTLDILKRYNAEYMEVELVTHQKNKGITKSFQEGIKLADKEIIFLCDQDDIWELNKAERFIEKFREEDDLLVFSNADLINETGEKINGSFFEKLNVTVKEKLLIEQNEADLVFRKRNIMAGSSAAFSSELKSIVLPLIHGETNMLHDRFIASVTAAIYPDRIGLIDEKLSSYRIHDNQTIGFKKINENQNVSKFDYYAKEAKLLEYVLERVENTHFRRAHYFWYMREQMKKMGFLRKLISANTLYLEGDYQRFTESPFKELMKDLV